LSHVVYFSIVQDPFKKHNKMLKNPAYSAIMDRYGAAPPKPKLLAKATLDRLSDPVKGKHIDENVSPQRTRVVRDTKFHPRKQGKPVASTRHRSSSKNNDKNDRDPYDHSPIRKSAWGDTPSSPPKQPRPSESPLRNHDPGSEGGGTGFFITGTNDEGEDYGDDDFESPPPSPAALRKMMEHAKPLGPEVSPIGLGMGCIVESPGIGGGRGGAGVYSPPDIYSPRTKEALRVSFNKEQTAATALPVPKKQFNALQFTGSKPEKQSNLPTRKSVKPSALASKKPLPKQTKVVKGRTKSKTKSSTRASSKTRGATGRTRGSSIERQSKVGPRNSTRRATPMDELAFDAPSKRVQLLSNKLKANKGNRSSTNNSSARGRTGDSSLLRSSSVKGIRSSSIGRDQAAQMGGSRSAPSLKRRQAGGRDVSEERLPTISASTSKPMTLPALRAKNLLGRKGVSPSLQERYADILQTSKEACRDDPPVVKQPAPGFGASSNTGRTKTKSLQPIMEKQKTMRQKPPPKVEKKMERKLKNRRATVLKQEESLKSPTRMAEENKEKRRKDEQLRREEQEKRIEARMLASKKKEEMDYRAKIRQQAEESLTKSKQSDLVCGSADDKLVLMFKTHCARLTSKLSDADKLSANFKSLKEFDGYSSIDREKMRPQEDPAPSFSSTREKSPTTQGSPSVIAAPTTNIDPDGAFLSKQLMV
jgi:hypothetical protein